MDSGARVRTQLFYSLICMVALLWSTFLVAEGIWFWVSMWITMVCVGTAVIVLVLRFR